MEAAQYVITASSLECPLDDNISLSFSPGYLTNLPFLTEFRSDDTLELIKDVTYLNESI